MRPILFFAFLFVSTLSIGQIYTSGSFTSELISVESTNDSPVNPIMKNMITENVGNEVNFDITFDKDVVTKGSLNILDEVLYSRYDIKSNNIYRIIESFGEKSFTRDPIPDLPEMYFLGITDFGEATPIKDKIFGLNCSKYTVTKERVELEFIMTSDIKMNKIPGLGHFPEKYGTMVQTTIKGLFPDIVITYGMTSFSSIIEDPSLLIIDTVGMENKTKLRDEVADIFLEDAKEDKADMLEFGEYDPSKDQNGLLDKFVELEALDTSDWSMSYEIKEKAIYDLPTLLLKIKRHKKGLPTMSRAEVLELMQKADLLQPILKDLLKTSDEEWSKIPEDLHYLAICLASIKDHLNKKEVRRQIIDNLIAKKHLQAENVDVQNLYIEGKSTLDDILEDINCFDPISKGIATTDEDIYQKIKTFFALVAKKNSLPINLSREQNLITITSDISTHKLDINSFKEIDYENSNYDLEPPSIDYVDSIHIDKRFYDGFLYIVKQIGADQSKELAFNIFELKPPYVYDIDEYDYKQITDQFPDLTIPVNGLFYQQFPKDDFDQWNNIGTSFSFHPEASLNELSIGNFSIGYGDAGMDYITSSQKIDMINYLNQNSISFGLDAQDLAYKVNAINDRLLEGSDALLDFLPNIKLTIDIVFDITPKSSYRPDFSEGRNDFKHAYYGLYRVLRDDFVATNFSYDKEEHKVHFTYKGQNHSVDPGDNNMINFIKKHMKTAKSGKQLYKVSMFSVTKAVYYYLTPGQKADLKKIADLNF